MKMMLRILKKDIKGLLRNFLAMVVAGGLCVLPSLYAWFNIYSNWDPYANTGGVMIAVVSEDEGYTQDGEYYNMGDKVIDNLHENTALGWVFLDSREEAVEGVTSGEYYAAIVMGADFSYSMFNFIDNGLKHPNVTYYQNEKKNAIAIKITDTGRGTLQNTINTEFTNTMVVTILEAAQEYNNGEGLTLLDDLSTKIEKLNENLKSYEDLMESMKECNVAISNSILRLNSLIPTMANAIDTAADSAGEINQSLNADADQVEKKIDALLTSMQAVTGQISDHITNAANAAGTDPAEATGNLNAAGEAIGALIASNQDLINSVEKLGLGHMGMLLKIALQAQNANLAALQGFVGQSGTLLGQGISNAKLAILRPILQDAANLSNTILNSYKGDIAMQIAELKKSMNSSVKVVQESLSETARSLSGFTGVLGSLSKSVLSVNDMLDGAENLIISTLEQTDELVNKLSEAGDEETYQRLQQILKTDPELYGSFLSAPVEVETIPVYEVKNYGSGVAPFYTTLALWVGGILLVSIFKVHAEAEDEFEGAKLYQLFLGRYLTFFLLGQIQTVICVLGNLYLLKIQCLHPLRFYLACSVISFVFTLLIYTLTNAFGDIGKALVVVLVVMQIAGSSGTYPIEILPAFYQKLYVYFPFPYACNALRECVAGMYENTYWIRLGQLLIFAVASLLLGLVIRIPFIEINEFVEERMHDTKIM